MYTFLIVLMVLDGLILGLVVLMQSGKGDGLAAMGGGVATEGIMAGRQATTMFTRASWICGGTFMVLALVLSIMSSRQQRPASILEQDFQQQQAPASEPTPLLPGAGTSGAPETGGSAPGTGAAPTTPSPTPPAGR